MYELYQWAIILLAFSCLSGCQDQLSHPIAESSEIDTENGATDPETSGELTYGEVCKKHAKELGAKHRAQDWGEILADAAGETPEEVLDIYTIEYDRIISAKPRVACVVQVRNVANSPRGPQLLCSPMDSDDIEIFGQFLLSIDKDMLARILKVRPHSDTRLAIVFDVVGARKSARDETNADNSEYSPIFHEFVIGQCVDLEVVSKDTK